MLSGIVRTALVSLAALASTVPAHAVVYWYDDDPMRPAAIMAPEPTVHQHRQKKLKRTGAKLEKLAKDTAKPVGPLVIAISLERQSLRVFDANGLFAESPVSTGMRGHSTPMGVFSVIQKNKWHRSNIYSGAPMPYMQRITWSGIALHAGVLPGYPASHGCIRMPMAFATKIWGWTRMGARVIITPGEISPVDFRHPLLATQKPAAAPVADAQPKEPTSTPKADKAASAVAPADLGLKRSTDADRTKTADASNAMVPPAAAVRTDAAAKPEDNRPADATRVTRRDVDEAAAKGLELAAAKPADGAAESAGVAPKADEAATKPAPAALPAGEPKKDDTRPADAPAPAPAAEAAPKRSGQIAVLVSGKDGKLYVRQNFAPLFETPVAIKPSDRPLGTHIFTARLDKDDSKTFHWSAVSLPAVPHRAEADDQASRRRKSTGAVEVKARPLPNSAAEALDRLTIPAETMGQITEALASGGSIIVSDQALAAGGETGQGTEFVVPLR